MGIFSPFRHSTVPRDSLKWTVSRVTRWIWLLMTMYD
jgi:hypothetical protein